MRLRLGGKLQRSNAFRGESHSLHGRRQLIWPHVEPLRSSLKGDEAEGEPRVGRWKDTRVDAQIRLFLLGRAENGLMCGGVVKGLKRERSRRILIDKLRGCDRPDVLREPCLFCPGLASSFSSIGRHTVVLTYLKLNGKGNNVLPLKAPC